MRDRARRGKGGARRGAAGDGARGRGGGGAGGRAAKARPPEPGAARAPRQGRGGADRCTAAGGVRQQIVVSGVGGQGVLFVARLLAEAAIDRGLPVLASETHGMAQRGGTVTAHLKVGPFSSPLVRPGRADVLILLKEENAASHGSYLRPGGWAAVNAAVPPPALAGGAPRVVDADALARETGLAKAVNLIVLGRALAAEGSGDGAAPRLFCTAGEIRDILRRKLAREEVVRDASLLALEIGLAQTIPARR